LTSQSEQHLGTFDAPEKAPWPYQAGVAGLRRVFFKELPASTHIRFGLTIFLTLTLSVCATLSPILFSRSIDTLNASRAQDAAVLLIGAIALWGAAKLLMETRWLVYQPAENRLLVAVREHYLSHILALPAKFHANRAIGRLDTIVGQGIGGVRSLVSAAFTQLAPVIFEIVVVVVAFAAVLSAELAVIVAGTVALYFACLFIGAERVSKRFRAALDSGIHAQGVAGDAILNAEGIKSMSLERAITSRYGVTMQAMYRRYLSFYYARGLFGLGLGAILITGFGLALARTFIGVSADIYSIGQLVLVNVLLLQLFRSIESFGFSYRDSRQAVSAVARFVELLSEPTERDEGHAHLPPVIDRIDVENVSFTYPDGRRGLMPISLSLSRGRITALLGPSGSGKSTIVRLLLKLYPLTDGRITLNGQALGDFSSEDVRNRIALVPQEAIILRDTLAFNIALSKDVDPSRLADAIRSARLDALVQRLPDGIESEIGERGVKVSGGERQRIGLARLFYKRPQILLLDEVTSALDGATRDEVLVTIQALAKDCCTLLITHDPKVAEIADGVVSLDEIDAPSGA